MSNKCETVIISDKAYNAIIRESFAKHPVETGGILLGYILDNGLWVVMEMIPPGQNGIFRPAYFEYDQDFVNYLGTSVANQYKEPLQVLGLWHRHPGSMDYFSSTDDGTNSEFAAENPYGVISGLVNIDPSFRLTMYHLDHNQGKRPRNIAYSTVEVEVGDDLIPEKFFELRYVDAEHSELHPTPAHTNTQLSESHNVPKSLRNGNGDETDETATQKNSKCPFTPVTPNKRKWLLPFLIIVIFAAGIFVGARISSPSQAPKKKIEMPDSTKAGNEEKKDSTKAGKERKDSANAIKGTKEKQREDSNTSSPEHHNPDSLSSPSTPKSNTQNNDNSGHGNN